MIIWIIVMGCKIHKKKGYASTYYIDTSHNHSLLNHYIYHQQQLLNINITCHPDPAVLRGEGYSVIKIYSSIGSE